MGPKSRRRAGVDSLLAFLGLSREHRPSSIEWDEVLAKDRCPIPVKQLLTTPKIPLTDPLTALYLRGGTEPAAGACW